MTKDEMVGWCHWLNEHEFEQAPGVGDGQGSLARCSPWGRKESDTTEQLNLTDTYFLFLYGEKAGKAMVTHSSVLAWRIPGAGETGGLSSLGLHRVGHD